MDVVFFRFFPFLFFSFLFFPFFISFFLFFLLLLLLFACLVFVVFLFIFIWKKWYEEWKSRFCIFFIVICSQLEAATGGVQTSGLRSAILFKKRLFAKFSRLSFFITYLGDCFWVLRIRCRINHPEVFYKKIVLKNFAKFTEKHLCQSLFLKKLQVSGVFTEHLWATASEDTPDVIFGPLFRRREQENS